MFDVLKRIDMNLPKLLTVIPRILWISNDHKAICYKIFSYIIRSGKSSQMTVLSVRDDL